MYICPIKRLKNSSSIKHIATYSKINLLPDLQLRYIQIAVPVNVKEKIEYRKVFEFDQN